ncbi:MAG: hypothetical protein WCG55_02345 [bacterium]
MKRIGDFLERFAKLAQSSDDAKNTVLLVLKKNSITISDLSKISIKGTSVQIKMSALQKNEVFLKQQKILLALKESPLTKHITRVG